MSALLPTYARSGLSFARGEGAFLFTEGGERYLDFSSGIAVTALGHAHPKLIEALSEQARAVWHVSNLHHIAEQERLGARLCAASFADKVFFANSGAEAVEASIKAARRHHFTNGAPERYRLLTFEGAFHGRTLATIAAGGQPKHLEGFGPPVDGFDQVSGFDIDAVENAIGAKVWHGPTGTATETKTSASPITIISQIASTKTETEHLSWRGHRPKPTTR